MKSIFGILIFLQINIRHRVQKIELQDFMAVLSKSPVALIVLNFGTGVSIQ